SSNSYISLNEYSEILFENIDLNELNKDFNNNSGFSSNEYKIKEIKRRIKENAKSKYDKDSELFLPKTEDYLRRCETNEEGYEIIEYQLKMGHISEEEAANLREIIMTRGIRAFGEKKTWGYYERTYRNSGNK
ncbi:MAG: DUF2095 family protein, partial [Promethearchaeota archaeon]